MAHSHESREATVDEVNAPTGSDSGSLAEDTNDAGPKAITISVDLSEEVVDVASAALERYNIAKDIAAQLKEFDKRHEPTYHVLVGNNWILRCSRSFYT